MKEILGLGYLVITCLVFTYTLRAYLESLVLFIPEGIREFFTP